MTHHSTAFEIDRPVPADEAVTERLPALPETALGTPPARNGRLPQDAGRRRLCPYRQL